MHYMHYKYAETETDGERHHCVINDHLAVRWGKELGFFKSLLYCLCVFHIFYNKHEFCIVIRREIIQKTVQEKGN